MIKNPKKIFIVGSPGSGKTTLARKLSHLLDIPHYDLDDIRHPHEGVKRTDKQAIPLVNELISKRTWIIEGVYISWVKECLDKTDLIIWLDIPYHIALYRITMRYIRNVLRRDLRFGLKSTLILIKNLTRYHFPKPGTELNDEDEYITRYKTADVLIKYKPKVVWIKNNQELTDFLQNLNVIPTETK